MRQITTIPGPSPFTRANLRELRRAITEEIYAALGLTPDTRLRHVLNPLVWAPVRRFVEIVDRFDQAAGQLSFPEAARIVLSRFITRLEVDGGESVPLKGPLLVAANHPGAADVLAIAASLPRTDLKIVVSSLPFFRGLPNSARHFIYTAHENSHQRMEVVRSSIRHLREGGSLLIFPRGVVEPDPELLPGADESLAEWSTSLGIIARAVPQAKVVPAIVSGVIARRSLRNPVTRLRSEPRERQKLAEIIQVLQQMVLPLRPAVSARLSFGRPFRAIGEDARAVTRQVVETARQLLADHMATV
jgi:hypothetical protein